MYFRMHRSNRQPATQYHHQLFRLSEKLNSQNASLHKVFDCKHCRYGRSIKGMMFQLLNRHDSVIHSAPEDVDNSHSTT